MNRYFKILSFLMLLFLLTAENCGDSSIQTSKDEKLAVTFHELENEFLNDELSFDKLRAFEIRAIQKLDDLIDYLNIYADSSLTSEFRIQSKKMIQKLFYSQEDSKNYFRNLSFVEDSVNSKLNYLVEKETVFTEIDSVKIIQSLQKKTNSLYAGEVQFSQSIFKTDNSDTIFIKSIRQNLEIVALKSEKQFGEKSQQVWEIFLAGLH